jgi:hypothetical protein
MTPRACSRKERIQMGLRDGCSSQNFSKKPKFLEHHRKREKKSASKLQK